MELDKSCPKCSSVMQRGFILDHTAHSSQVVARWQPGEPQKSFWVGVQTKDSPPYEIQAYRCTACGYLESYAL